MDLNQKVSASRDQIQVEQAEFSNKFSKTY